MSDDPSAPAEAAPQQETTDVKATAKKTTAPAPAKKAAAPATPAPRRSRKEAAENLKRAKTEARTAKKAAPPKAAPKAAPKGKVVEAINKHQQKAGARADGLKPGTGAAILVDTLKRAGGATNAELCEAVGWAACLPAARKACERAGLVFEGIKKTGELTRYHARKK